MARRPWPARLADSYGGGVDQLQSSWRVMSGTTLRSYSEYNEATASTYFTSDAFKLSQYRLTGVDVVTPRMPVDGGSVVFKASIDPRSRRYAANRNPQQADAADSSIFPAARSPSSAQGRIAPICPAT